MVHDDPVPFFESSHAWAAFHDLPGRFMPGDFVLVAFGSFSQVLVVDGADVTAADRGGFCADQHLSVPRFRDLHFLEHHSAVARQIGCFHQVFHNITPHIKTRY